MVRKLAATVVSFAVTGTFLLFVAYSRSGPATTVGHAAIQPTFSSPIPSGRAEAELLVLRSDGFKPSEITRPPGRFLLALQNHSSAEEISLVLKQESGASMREVRLAKGQSKSKEILELPPGRYVLTEVNHPEWICTIVITPE